MTLLQTVKDVQHYMSKIFVRKLYRKRTETMFKFCILFNKCTKYIMVSSVFRCYSKRAKALCILYYRQKKDYLQHKQHYYSRHISYLYHGMHCNMYTIFLSEVKGLYLIKVMANTIFFYESNRNITQPLTLRKIAKPRLMYL